jgi:hypothetical protein
MSFDDRRLSPGHVSAGVVGLVLPSRQQVWFWQETAQKKPQLIGTGWPLLIQCCSPVIGRAGLDSLPP